MAIKKAAPKKAAPKKAAPKKAPAKAKVAATAAAVAPKRKTTVISEKMTKTQILTEIAENTNLTRKQVGDVLEELEVLIERSVKKRPLGEFTIPGLMKITTVKKPATKARKGINPFTGAETMFKAKPASVAVKVRPLKKLKDFAI